MSAVHQQKNAAAIDRQNIDMGRVEARSVCSTFRSSSSTVLLLSSLSLSLSLSTFLPFPYPFNVQGQKFFVMLLSRSEFHAEQCLAFKSRHTSTPSQNCFIRLQLNEIS